MANYLPPRTLPRLKSVSGGTHALERKLCPASGQKYKKKCGKEGHFAVKCRSKSEDAKDHMVEQEEFFTFIVSVVKIKL